MTLGDNSINVTCANCALFDNCNRICLLAENIHTYELGDELKPVECVRFEEKSTTDAAKL